MVPVIYKLKALESGWLAIMGRPRSGDWAESEFAGLARLGVTDIVSLLEPTEALELGLQGEAALCAAASIAFHSFPIPDRGVPASASDLSRLACRLYHSASEGHGIVVHCRAGIGRSSLVAAAILLHEGCTPDQALSQIAEARGLPVPDTPQQAEWLRKNLSVIAKCQLSGRGSRHESTSVA